MRISVLTFIHFSDGKGLTLYQLFLIDQIIQALSFDTNTTKVATRNTPDGYPLLNKDENGPARKASLEIPWYHRHAWISARNNTS